MSRSFARAELRDESAGPFRHLASEQEFAVTTSGGRIAQKRWPLDAPARTFERAATYSIGSGNHARSFLHAEPNGTLTQMPLTWYTQIRQWAMSPGYDQNRHAGFSRQIDPGCLFCHSSFPKTVASFGKVNRYEEDLPLGIGCERCHGEGSAHAAAPSAKNIVNPGKLPFEQKRDVCFQCHLETTSAKLPHAVRRAGRAVASFRPGQRLDDYLVQFDHPPGAGAENKFEINSAGYRMLQSACSIKSGTLTCTTCHNAHAPAAAESARRACQGCHTAAHDPGGDCATCHMPRRRTEDAVQVVLTEASTQSQQQMHQALEQLCARQVPGDTYQNLVIHPAFSGQTFKHILVPVWLLTYLFGAKSFQVLVNGSTGRIAGKYPLSGWKIFFVVVIVMSILLILSLATES